ncbi:MAG TPA: transglutaminase domain-containing protein [bacterium]
MRKMCWLPGLALAAVHLAALSAAAAERSGTIRFNISLATPADASSAKLWFPYPTSDLDQEITGLTFSGTYSNFSLSREARSGALYLYTEWRRPAGKPTLTVSFHAKARERKAPRLAERGGAIPPDVAKYVRAEFWIPSDDAKIVALAAKIVEGKSGILARARAVYDWTVENTRRDPDVPGCGTGRVQATLASRSGKCADISSVFVALARATGVPAREVFGLRLGQPGETDVTDGHHCWAEFYLPGTGWVPVDPADVRKIMLARNLDLAAARPYRDYYFGAVDQYRIVLHKGGRGVAFAEGNLEKVNYFMYPYAEIDGRPLDYCRPKTFSFTVAFHED